MKYKALFLITFLFLVIFSCEQPNMKPELDLLEQVAIELEKQGLSVTRITE